jgi:hypothetical protein
MISYFSCRLPAMRVVWEESTPTWMVLTGPPSALDGCTFGTLVGTFGTSDPLDGKSRGPSSVVRASSFCCQGVQLLDSCKRSGAVAPHSEDPNRG